MLEPQRRGGAPAPAAARRGRAGRSPIGCWRRAATTWRRGSRSRRSRCRFALRARGATTTSPSARRSAARRWRRCGRAGPRRRRAACVHGRVAAASRTRSAMPSRAAIAGRSVAASASCVRISRCAGRRGGATRARREERPAQVRPTADGRAPASRAGGRAAGASDADRMPASCSTCSVRGSPAQLISTRWPLWKRRSRWVRISQRRTAAPRAAPRPGGRAGRPAAHLDVHLAAAAQVVRAGRADEAAEQRQPAAGAPAAAPTPAPRAPPREAHARTGGPPGLAHERRASATGSWWWPLVIVRRDHLDPAARERARSKSTGISVGRDAGRAGR